jgi:cytochrome c peroxidase
MHNKIYGPSSRRISLELCLAAAFSMTLAASSGGESTTTTPAPSGPSAAALLGAQIFADTALSESGRQSCASCHVACFAFTADPTAGGPDHGLPVPMGGPSMDRPGFCNTPSLMYLSLSPSFYFDADGNPNGGFFRDGRAATLTEQAIAPFTSQFEMANADAAAVVAKLKGRPYLADFCRAVRRGGIERSGHGAVAHRRGRRCLCYAPNLRTRTYERCE